ncbi:LysR family transcriptional regulator [Lapidilactobacillus luobeiensis]|uniref:LysR family transcriptional regulator n=1 Tax=Lapidilactobacillus luobeiensis TaxID=2950371 RepID=UPI0021C2AAA1|nr:LysR family transcriptional regulator [Lapidilactobacillus luobeiensis]
MNIRQLRIFLSVCETGSVTKTAQRFFLSQPAISKTLAELEQEIGLPLFDRIHARLVLNRDGQNFQIRAIQLVRDYQSLADFKHRQARNTPLNLGVSLTIGTQALTPALQQFHQDYAKTPIKVYAENVDQIQRRLLAGEIDVAFIEGFQTNRDFERQSLSSYRLFCVADPHADFWPRRLLSLAEAARLPFLLRERGSSLRDHWESLLWQEQLLVDPVIESVNTEVLVNAACGGLGLTILPEPYCRPYFATNQLQRVMIDAPELATENYAVTLKGKRQNQRIQHLIACFKEKMV